MTKIIVEKDVNDKTIIVLHVNVIKNQGKLVNFLQPPIHAYKLYLLAYLSRRLMVSL